MTKCITLGLWLWERPWLLVLSTEVTYGKGSLLTEQNLDMSTKTTFKFIFIMVVVYSKRCKNPPSVSAPVGKKPAEKNSASTVSLKVIN